MCSGLACPPGFHGEAGIDPPLIHPNGSGGIHVHRGAPNRFLHLIHDCMRFAGAVRSSVVTSLDTSYNTLNFSEDSLNSSENSLNFSDCWTCPAGFFSNVTGETAPLQGLGHGLDVLGKFKHRMIRGRKIEGGVVY